MKRLFQILIIIFFLTANQSFGQAFEWSHLMEYVWGPGVRSIDVDDIVVDSSQHVYTCGNEVICAGCNFDAWLTSYNQSTNTSTNLFGNVLGGIDHELKIDYSGDVVYFNKQAWVSNGQRAYFLKYDQFENYQWYLDVLGSSFCFDPQNNIFLVNIDTIKKYDPTGNFINSFLINDTCFDKKIVMDKDYNLYVYSNSGISKYDTTGFLIWNDSLLIEKKVLTDGSNHIYLLSDSLVEVRDENKNLLTTIAAHPVDVCFDDQANLYLLFSDSIVKYDTSGNIIWSTGEIYPSLNAITIDQYNNIYYTGYYWYDYPFPLPAEISVPPSIHYNGTNYPGFDLFAFAGKINQSEDTSFAVQVTFVDALNNLFCSGNNYNVYYYLNRLPFSKKGINFQVQLSDATGSFTNAITIGKGTSSPINIYIPDSITTGTNYLIRIVASDSSVISSPYSTPLSAYTSPEINLDCITCLYDSINEAHICFYDTTTIVSSVNILFPTYEWYRYDMFNGYMLQQFTDSVFETNTQQFFDTIKVVVTDPLSGCAAEKKIRIVPDFLNPTQFYSLPELCDSNDVPINLMDYAYPLFNLNSIWFSGDGVVDSTIFYADSAGPGWHYITITSLNACGIAQNIDSIFVSPCLPQFYTDSVNLPNNAICAGSPLTVNFTSNNITFDSANVFYVQLSGPNGGFANPLVIGTPPIVTIPDTITEGYGYRVRIVSTSPALNATRNKDPFSIFELPPAALSSSGNYSFCSGLQFLDTVITDNSNSIQWYNGSIPVAGGDVAPISISTAGIYFAHVTSGHGCETITDSVVLVVNPLPVIIFSGLPDTVCLLDAPVTFNVSPSGGILSGNGLTGNTFYGDSVGLGIFPMNYQFTDSLGCFASSTFNVTVDSCFAAIYTDAVDVSGNGFCPGADLTVPFHFFNVVFDINNTFVVQLSDALGNFANAVNIGSPASSIIPLNSIAGNEYRIRILSTIPSMISSSNADGPLNIHPKPQINFTIADSLFFCQNDSSLIQFLSDDALAVDWFFNGGLIQSGTDTFYYAHNSGYYNVIVTNSFGCSNTSTTIHATVNQLPNISFSGLPDTLCINHQSVLITPNIIGGILSGAGLTGNLFYPDSAGIGAHTIFYSYTDSNNCSNTYFQTVWVDGCTGIETYNSGTVAIVPNPFYDDISIHFNKTVSSKKVNVSVYDLFGKKVYSKEVFQNATVKLDLTFLASGTYFIKIETGIPADVFKIVKL